MKHIGLTTIATLYQMFFKELTLIDIYLQNYPNSYCSFVFDFVFCQL